MNLPLIEPSPIVVEPIDRDATIKHQYAREEVKTLAREAAAPIQFNAQVYWQRKGFQRARREGNTPESSGYLTTRKWVLDNAAYTPRTGDLLTAIGTQTDLRLYVTGFEPSGHLSGGNTLFLIYFSDRNPSKGG